MDKKFNLFGHEINISKGADNKTVEQFLKNGENPFIDGFDDKQLLQESIELLTDYRRDKEPIETRLLENDKWYKSLHWQMIKGDQDSGEPEPTSAYTFDTINRKHADLMEFFPKANLLPEESDDEQESKNLTSIIPKELRNAKFRKTYDKLAWNFLTHGWCVAGTFFNPEAKGGLGSIDVTKINMLNFYWKTGIEELEESPSVFLVNPVDDESLKLMYPNHTFSGEKVFDIKEYSKLEDVDTEGQSLIVDRYYKALNSEGKEVLHLVKFCEKTILFASEGMEEFKETGIYEHGRYPFTVIACFPVEGSITGFGMVDISKNPQMYIDKLDSIISMNALLSGRPRWLAKANSGLNVDDYMDWSKQVIEVPFSLSEDNIRQVEVKPLDASISNHRTQKIEELKQVTATNEFSRGEGGKGVTAAQAILALQKAGSKISRVMVNQFYDLFTDVVYLIIEIVREFYDMPRTYRIDDDKGGYEFVTYSNEMLKVQASNDPKTGDLYERRPEFDIKVVPEKVDPFSQAVLNELAMEMYRTGMLDPEKAIQAKAALSIMEFDGKEKIIEIVESNDQMFRQYMQMAEMLQMFQAENQKLKVIAEKTTGRDLGSGMMQSRQAGAVNG